MGNRWLESSVRRSAEDYDRSWADMVRTGKDPHGEAGLIAALGPANALDAGCGTGRVALELARRGVDVTGVDIDAAMLEGARGKDPTIEWVCADLAEVELRDAAGDLRRFDVAVLAGNVMIFLEQGSEAAVVANIVRHLAPTGALVAGFQLAGERDGQLDPATYDELCAGAGLVLEQRWSTWDRDPFVPGGRYAVSLHRRRS